jgi:hypothetical protein
MAAESVGLAASVAGLVSLGLQIAGGIIKYVDACENRQEELSFVKRESEVLKAVLLEVDAQLRSHGQSGDGHDAVVQSMTLFKEELSYVQALYTNLADSGPQSWTARLENKKKKATYAFNRVKIQELGLRLQKAGDALQLTLNVLSL